ncbi:MAG: class I SAM-dependent methyltransferase [Acidobacteriota bacterium]
MKIGKLRHRLYQKFFRRIEPHPAPSAQTVREFKEAAWQSPEAASRYFETVSRISPGMQTELDAALRFARGRILDVGAGTGRFSSALVRAEHPVTAIDLSADMLRLASANEPALDCARASAFALPFADEQFDTVVSFWLLLHFHEWPQILSEMLRVAKPQARIIFEMQNASNLEQACRITGDDGLVPKKPNEFQTFASFEEVQSMAARAGASVLWSRRYDLFSDNLVARATLRERYDGWMNEIRDAFDNEGCCRFWIRFEEEHLSRLPQYMARKIIFVLGKENPEQDYQQTIKGDESHHRLIASNEAVARSINLFLEAFASVCPDLSDLFEPQCIKTL